MLSHSPEMSKQRFDAVIVLGENIKKHWGPNEIRYHEERDGRHLYLSPYSKANVLATSILYLMGVTNTFIFSTAHTAGKSVLSEAEAMANHFRKLLQPLPNYDVWAQKGLHWPLIILEEKSLSTSSNAREVAKIIKSNKITNLGLLTVDFHMPRAELHFKRHGINARTISTQDVLQTVLPGIKDKFMTPQMLDQELRRERIITAVEKLPLGTTATGFLARLTRK